MNNSRNCLLNLLMGFHSCFKNDNKEDCKKRCYLLVESISKESKTESAIYISIIDNILDALFVNPNEGCISKEMCHSREYERNNEKVFVSYRTKFECSNVKQKKEIIRVVNVGLVIKVYQRKKGWINWTLW